MYPLQYDTVYDNSSLSTSVLACSNGANGLATKGYATIGALPTYPRVGGAPPIAGWNSPNCGSCWRLTYNGRNLTVTAIDHANGWNLSLQAMNNITNGHAEEFGRVNGTYTRIANSACGL